MLRVKAANKSHQLHFFEVQRICYNKFSYFNFRQTPIRHIIYIRDDIIKYIIHPVTLPIFKLARIQ